MAQAYTIQGAARIISPENMQALTIQRGVTTTLPAQRQVIITPPELKIPWQDSRRAIHPQWQAMSLPSDPLHFITTRKAVIQL